MSSYDPKIEAILRRLFKEESLPPFPTVRENRTSPMWVIPQKRDLKSPLSKKWKPSFYRSIKNDLKRHSRKVPKRVKEITKGLTMPALSRVRIGSGKSMDAAIMFFDLENFTARSAKLGNEGTLYVLDIIIPQIINIIRYWKGEIEKNTGDGVMAIFGTETRNDFIIARDAIEVAMTIRYVMQHAINPMLEDKSIDGFNFKMGIDMGSVLIGNIGVINNSFLTVVGKAANIAYELQELAASNAIFIGDTLFENLSPKVQRLCEERKHSSWKWIYTGTKIPYRFFEFVGNWPDPSTWIRTKF